MGAIIRGLPSVVFLIMVALPLAMAGLAIFAARHARRRAAIVSSMPTTPIGMATDGYREIEGTVEAVPGAPVRAPLTLIEVGWYHAKIEKWTIRKSGTPSGWTTIKEATSGMPFLVRDATGVCMVRPDGAEVTPTDRSVWHGATPVPADRNPPKVGPTESAMGMVEVAGGPNSKFRYTEERIYTGDPLLAHGELSTGRFGARIRDGVGDAVDDAIDAAEEEAGEDDALDESAADVGDQIDDGDDQAGDGDDWDDVERAERAQDEAQRITKASIGQGSGSQPFMLTTTAQAEHVRLTGGGSAAAFGVAVVPLALAALLLWVRFG